MPERLDLKLEAPTAALSPQETQTIKATGRYLYGPPAADLAIEGDIVVKPSSKDVDGYPGYPVRPGRRDASSRCASRSTAPTTTDARGHRRRLPLRCRPSRRRPSRSKPSVILRLRESGGRTIERTITLPVDLQAGAHRHQAAVQGQRPRREADGIASRSSCSTPTASASPPTALNWVLNRLDSNWQWYRRDGQWNYEAVTLTRKVADGTLDATADGALAEDRSRRRLGPLPARDHLGRCRTARPPASRSTPAGTRPPAKPRARRSSTSRSTSASYKPGETAKLRIASKHGGKALIVGAVRRPARACRRSTSPTAAAKST